MGGTVSRSGPSAEEAMMKFLVIWRIELALLSREMATAVGDMAAYGETVEREGKVLARYHIVGAHGGAWIYAVESHEEFERLLARSPVFNFARYEVHPLADMAGAAPTHHRSPLIGD
jgi:muconolactone delta-isomerase